MGLAPRFRGRSAAYSLRSRAEFERDRHNPVGGCSHNELAHFRRAGERKLAHHRVVGERGTAFLTEETVWRPEICGPADRQSRRQLISRIDPHYNRLTVIPSEMPARSASSSTSFGCLPSAR